MYTSMTSYIHETDWRKMFFPARIGLALASHGTESQGKGKADAHGQ